METFKDAVVQNWLKFAAGLGLCWLSWKYPGMAPGLVALGTWAVPSMTRNRKKKVQPSQ